MNWGVKITLSFIAFVLIMITMVMISMRQDVNLVADDYYKQEIAYESQIERIKNTNNLASPPKISFNRGTDRIYVSFSSKLADRVRSGEVLLYRPSDRNKDVKAQLILDDSDRLVISMIGRDKGLWKIKMTWNISLSVFGTMKMSLSFTSHQSKLN